MAVNFKRITGGEGGDWLEDFVLVSEADVDEIPAP